MTDIKQEQAHNPDQWENTDPHFIEPLILEWASMPDAIKFQPQQIPVGIEFFSNVLYSGKNNCGEDKLILTVYNWPERLRTIFKEHRRYRITVTVTGDQVKPQTTEFIVDWKGHWRFATLRHR